MRFEQLEYLVAVAECGSFSAAAQKLFVTQQAISLGMKQLEQEMGQQLFIKEKNKTILTYQGEKLLEFANRTLREKYDLLKEFQETMMDNQLAPIKIGSTSCVANITLPSIIAEWELKKRNTFFDIASMESMYTVLQQVATGEKDIGLISMNAQELKRKFAEFEDLLQIELLAQDEIVVVINRKNYKGNQEFIAEEEYATQLKTQYNIEPVENWRNTTTVPFTANSNDVDFHRAMLEKANASVTMSGLSYQYFFNNKKYVALPLENVATEIHHVAVYRKNAEPHIQELVYLIRKKMHMK